jgi:hypothetical protein
MTDGLSRAERARRAAGEEKKRLDALAEKSEREASDILLTTGGGTVPPPPNPAPLREETTAQAVDAPPISLSADGPIAPQASRKAERQGIDLRPIDRDRVDRFDLFCLRNRVKIGKKRGLSLYARAGFILLEELIDRDQAAAESILRRAGGAE